MPFLIPIRACMKYTGISVSAGGGMSDVCFPRVLGGEKHKVKRRRKEYGSVININNVKSNLMKTTFQYRETKL
jgi:hypothetical protein